MRATVSLLGLMSLLLVTTGARGGCGIPDGGRDGRDQGQTDGGDAIDGGCAPVACLLYCEEGFEVGPDGCERCVCRQPTGTACWQDSECAPGQHCDRVNYCDSPPGCEGSEGCPPVCYGRCIDDDGISFEEQLCLDTNGRWDPWACGPRSCDQEFQCEAIIPGCDCGDTARWVEGQGCVADPSCRADRCWGAWRDHNGLCRTPSDGVYPDECCKDEPTGCDGGEVACDALPPECPPPFVAAARDGCWACVDPSRDCAPACAADSDCGPGEACVVVSRDPALAYGVCQPVPVCEPLACRMNCPHGLKTDPATGCNVCECNEPPDCVCTQEYAPVCGADGNTYSNACHARCAGVAIASPGECRASCDIQCFAYDPVCGTDGVTYGCGAAEAACHGVEVAHPGECRTDCLCTTEYAPVCASDGRTYSNACNARCGGLEVLHPGACGVTCRSDAECRWGEKCQPAPAGATGAECVPVDFCYGVEDCNGLAPTLSCVGSWSCETNVCRYACGR